MDSPNIIDIRNTNRSQWQGGNNTHEFLIIHYLGVKNADNPNLYNNGYGGHFNITRDGKIYQVADYNTVLWHIGNPGCYTDKHPNGWNPTNYNSIGIENSVCYDSDWYFTKETEESLVELTKYLMKELNIDSDHVLRHFDVLSKRCPEPYVANTKHNGQMTWDEFKARISDKGDKYMFTCEQIKIGDSGNNSIYLAQEILKARGLYTGELDKSFGAKMDSAVKAYQKFRGLTPDGVIGSKTWADMIAL